MLVYLALETNYRNRVVSSYETGVWNWKLYRIVKYTKLGVRTKDHKTGAGRRFCSSCTSRETSLLYASTRKWISIECSANERTACVNPSTTASNGVDKSTFKATLGRIIIRIFITTYGLFIWSGIYRTDLSHDNHLLLLIWCFLQHYGRFSRCSSF